MKLARFKKLGATAYGIVDNETITTITPGATAEYAVACVDLLHALANGDTPEAAGWSHGPSYAMADVTLLAPLARPGKIIGVGRNYEDHATEMAVEPPDVPKIFFKWPGAVIGPDEAIRHTPDIVQLDHEVEIAVVIGKLARYVARDNALRHVAGLTIVNDVSERALQMMPKAGSTSLGKSLDTFCPMGPWIVTLDEVGDLNDLELSCWVNGERVQHGHTAQMIFRIPFLIEYLSRFITLEPGDVIATGTPSGVGMYRTPPTWLQPGDTVRLAVSRIGALENPVVAAPG